MKKERLSNIEMLRIVAMFFIIFSHFCSHGDFKIVDLNLNTLYLQSIQILGKIGVNIFVLISGYFLITQKEFKLKKLIIMWLQILFYSITLYLIFGVLIFKKFSIIEFGKMFFPITLKSSWYASVYFILYLICPYLNKLLNSLEKKEYIIMLLTFTIVWCVLPTVLTKDFECNSLLWFIYLYSLSGFFRLYTEIFDKLKQLKHITFITILSYISCILLIYILDFIKIDYKLFFGIQKLPTLIVSVLIFILFNKIQISNNSFINKISKCTFGVYLIHDNSIARDFIWIHFFKVNSFYKSPYLILYSIYVVTTIFIVCTCIEYVRIKIESKYVNKIPDFELCKSLKVD